MHQEHVFTLCKYIWNDITKIQAYRMSSDPVLGLLGELQAFFLELSTKYIQWIIAEHCSCCCRGLKK